MAVEPFILTAVVALAVTGFWALTPRCPECGCLLSIRDTMDPSLRHCRRCMSIYRTERRR